MNPYFPFHTLGYQCNPFRALTDTEWVDIVVPHPQVKAMLADPPAHLQVIGEKGHGKTTTLLYIAAHARANGQRAAYEHLEVEARHYTTSPTGLDLFCLDEAQRLAPTERTRLLTTLVENKNLRTVIGTHEDLSPLFDHYHLPLVTLQLETVPLTHVEAVIRRRLDYFVLNPAQPGTVPTPQALAALHHYFGANLRKIEQVLYEVYQQAATGNAGEIGYETVMGVANGWPV
jgi:hypothetical protein